MIDPFQFETFIRNYWNQVHYDSKMCTLVAKMLLWTLQSWKRLCNYSHYCYDNCNICIYCPYWSPSEYNSCLISLKILQLLYYILYDHCWHRPISTVQFYVDLWNFKREECLFSTVDHLLHIKSYRSKWIII